MTYRLTTTNGTPTRPTIERHPTLEEARRAARGLARLLGRPVNIEEWGMWYGEPGWMQVEVVEPEK